MKEKFSTLVVGRPSWLGGVLSSGKGVRVPVEAHDVRRPTHDKLFCHTKIMATADPKSVKVHLTSGKGVEIQWNDGHLSSYTFPYLRDACPCALCQEERQQSGRKPGDPEKPKPGALPMFKPGAKPESAEPVGKYAIQFKWNDNHALGIYSWQWLREICPCKQCQSAKTQTKVG